jgi:hypothetical protein
MSTVTSTRWAARRGPALAGRTGAGSRRTARRSRVRGIPPNRTTRSGSPSSPFPSLEAGPQSGPSSRARRGPTAKVVTGPPTTRIMPRTSCAAGTGDIGASTTARDPALAATGLTAMSRVWSRRRRSRAATSRRGPVGSVGGVQVTQILKTPSQATLLEKDRAEASRMHEVTCRCRQTHGSPRGSRRGTCPPAARPSGLPVPMAVGVDPLCGVRASGFRRVRGDLQPADLS